MGQVTTGVRATLSRSGGYNRVQNLLGGWAAREKLRDRFFPDLQDARVLDIGCGTANILDHLPRSVDYVGFDLSANYIAAARSRFGDRAQFFRADIRDVAMDTLGRFDLVLAFGLLHHLDDEQARRLCSIAAHALHSTGKFMTIDPCWISGQTFLSRTLVSLDRGQNVRPADNYAKLADEFFATIEEHHSNDLLRVPYDHLALVAQDPVT